MPKPVISASILQTDEFTLGYGSVVFCQLNLAGKKRKPALTNKAD
jgi:hypothetical protein